MRVRGLPGVPIRAAAGRAAGAFAAMRSPPRPVPEPPERAALLGRRPADEAFITGNGIAARCRNVLNYEGPVSNEDVENDWWFCKADHLEYFFRELAPDEGLVLFSHNSDRSIGRRFRRELARRRLVAWYAQNPALSHPKLHALPIGVANPGWPHGDQAALKRVQADPPRKTTLLDASFDLATNPGERRYCLEQAGLEPAPRTPFPAYLERLAASYFCLSPRGSGTDSHRTWEALYLRTVPIVVRSPVSEQHPGLPMLVLDDWSQLRSLDLGPELYERAWAGWDPDELRLDRYIERIEADLLARRAGVPARRRSR